jgi:hypothetical protein
MINYVIVFIVGYFIGWYCKRCSQKQLLDYYRKELGNCVDRNFILLRERASTNSNYKKHKDNDLLDDLDVWK